MTSKQAKDFLNELSEMGKESFKSELNNEIYPSDIKLILGLGSDFDIDKFILELDKQSMEEVNKESSIGDALNVLCKALEDKDYFNRWQSSIAMAFKDEFIKMDPNLLMNHLKINNIANKAAHNFLKELMK